MDVQRGQLSPPAGWLDAGLATMGSFWHCAERRWLTAPELCSNVSQECGVAPRNLTDERLGRFHANIPASWKAALRVIPPMTDRMYCALPDAAVWLRTAPATPSATATYRSLHVNGKLGRPTRRATKGMVEVQWTSRRELQSVRTVFAGDVGRLTWAGRDDDTATTSGFSVRAARDAAARARWVKKEGAAWPHGTHQPADDIAAADPDHPTIRWPRVWMEGWRAPWPSWIRDAWWCAASGAAYFSAWRRHMKNAVFEEAMCPACWDDGVAHLDRPEHVYYTCPSLLPLWDWVEGMLARDHVHVSSVPAFVLYGTQLCSLDADSTPQQLWRVQALRGAALGAMASARSAALNPEAEVPWRGLAVRHATSLLRAAITLDFFSAQRRHDAGTHTHALDGLLLPAGQPHDIPTFGSSWKGYVRVLKHRHLRFRFDHNVGQYGPDSYDYDDDYDDDCGAGSDDQRDRRDHDHGQPAAPPPAPCDAAPAELQRAPNAAAHPR